jgi:hypothetical protein
MALKILKDQIISLINLPVFSWKVLVFGVTEITWSNDGSFSFTCVNSQKKLFKKCYQTKIRVKMWPKKFWLFFQNCTMPFQKKRMLRHKFFLFFKISAHLGNISHTRKTLAQVGWVGCIGAVIKDFSNNQWSSSYH